MKNKITLSLLIGLLVLIAIFAAWKAFDPQSGQVVEDSGTKTVDFAGTTYEVQDYTITKLNSNGNVNAKLFIGERKVTK